MKKILILFLIMLFLISCSSDNNKPGFDEQFTAEYSEKDLIPEISLLLLHDPDPLFLSDATEKYPGGKFVYFEDSLYYVVHKLKEGGYCYYFFIDRSPRNTDIDGTLIGAFIVKNPLKKSNFDNLTGATLEDVTSFDYGLDALIKQQDDSHSMLYVTTHLKTFHLLENGFAKVIYNFDEEKFKKENFEIDLFDVIDSNDRDYLYKYFLVEKVEFIENGGLFFEEGYPEMKEIDGEFVYVAEYNEFKTTLNPEDYPFG